ncbi:c2H2-type domain-containing protein [Caerostris extrusa]|uniref:C2H2-type domain-containing protein n=1 Tax=Caerostris extrusa TaxID=172846 RepID=A0AAV4XLT6_CAEEX|nr:c2H2-type domain-containing protein [Caerostris extrusa]
MLFLENTKEDKPDTKCRRDKEFLQRHRELYTIIVKIQKNCRVLPFGKPASASELFKPTSKLRLENSVHFKHVFHSIRCGKKFFNMKSYGPDKDLCVLPLSNITSEDLKNDDEQHEMIAFILVERYELTVKQDLCIGLGFQSSPYTFENCLSELSFIGKETVTGLREELDMEHNEYCPKEVKENLISMFKIMDEELNSLFSDLKKASEFQKTQFDPNRPR